jgi:hypothetical protein
MSQVEFDEAQAVGSYKPKPSFSITQLFISWGLAKDDAGANTMMVLVSVAFLALALFLIVQGGSGGPDIGLAPEPLIEPR